MPTNSHLQDAIVDFIKDNPEQYPALHKAVYERTKGKPFADVADAIRPLALGRLAALKAGRTTTPYRPDADKVAAPDSD